MSYANNFHKSSSISQLLSEIIEAGYKLKSETVEPTVEVPEITIEEAEKRLSGILGYEIKIKK